MTVESTLHPDKSPDAVAFVRIFAERLVSEKGHPMFSAIAAGWREWRKSPFRAQMMSEYNRRGFGLQDSHDAANKAKRTNATAPTLKASSTRSHFSRISMARHIASLWNG